MGKKIECYIDCGISPYKLCYFAYKFLSQHREVLERNGVETEFIPVFLGGINVGTGNKPPGELPHKANYSKFDGKRAQKFFGTPPFETPSFFPILSLRPQRCLIYTKQHYPRDQYEQLFHNCFIAMWNEHLDLSKPENMKIAVSRAFPDPADQEAILDSPNIPEIKVQLTTNTEHAFKDCGAFGCPWFWVSDGEGKHEPFFGSDHFHFMFDYLDIPHCGMQPLEPDDTTHGALSRARL